jgi:hypothetical protein
MIGTGESPRRGGGVTELTFIYQFSCDMEVPQLERTRKYAKAPKKKVRLNRSIFNSNHTG